MSHHGGLSAIVGAAAGALLGGPGGLITGAAIGSASKALQPGFPKPPSIPAAPSQAQTASQESEEMRAAAQAQASALQRRRGLASTILTGPLGFGGTSQTQHATLGA